MAIVIISSADEQTRRELAVNLARKLGCDSMSREQILDAATEAGIAVGRLGGRGLKRLAPERRINNTMVRLGLDRDKAIEYIRNLDEDLDNWSHFVHGVGLTEPQYFDLVFNLQNISIESASAALCSMAQLSDFQPTPASIRAMKNLWLAAKGRHQIGTHG